MKSIKDINFAGRKVLLRVDFNVPMNDQKQITDDTRMRESMPTIEKLLKDGAAIIIMAHFGRPKKGGFEPELTLEPVAKYLETLVGRPVKFTQELLGSGKPEAMAKELKGGEVMLLENIRFYPEETKGGEDLARQLAALGDCYINDAFGAAHREHSSTAVIAKFFPNDKYFGFLMENEVRNLEKLMQNPPRPFTAIIGGSKVSSKIGILENLLDKVDNMIIIGGMRYTFTKALGGKIGNSICEDDKLDLARELMRRMDEKGVKYYLPVDSVIGDKFGNDANTQIVASGEVPDGWESMDCGPESCKAIHDIV
ncbi:MAG: phosphoglycerate kinase, partial [Bacteroidales bacterium]|nr:phosphoglycerate kinase [Bacteroidales bacterium]